MRIALLTLEALANRRAVRRFVAAHADDIALVGLSDPYRPQAGGAFGQTWRRLRRSGPRILPYLVLNFALPGLVDALRRAPPGDVDRTPLARSCAERGIPTAKVEDVNGPAFRDALAASGAELLVSFHFDQILTAETIAAAPFGGINVHPGLLPLHRGPVPTIHALLDEPIRLGVSIHRLAPRIDAGGLLAQTEMADAPGLTALAAAARLHEAALPLLDRVLPEIAAGSASETPLPVLPYRAFPTRAEMAALARKGRRAAGLSDVGEALRG
ncbi:formyltransferase family protein [Enterovirga rhinocerotis]|uniref:Formyl transferase-like protein n=1 Tax=Enterovirga rhinocerotis TaxID=1339210 RepID=A0A4R7C5V3_9HYPH|nr:formyltransferase family protein [Enterovirga rhinocerotis]TDR93778.1 formyl transferase-like protein [Enterovirga rhinocerotis]